MLRCCYVEASDHALSLGIGPFILLLEDATESSAIVVGKPTQGFFETVLRDLNRDLVSTYPSARPCPAGGRSP